MKWEQAMRVQNQGCGDPYAKSKFKPVKVYKQLLSPPTLAWIGYVVSGIMPKLLRNVKRAR